MTKVLVTEAYLDNIGDAIRAKLGNSLGYKPSQMAAAIGQIQTADLETKSITANGTYTPSTGKDGFSQVTVNVPNSYAAGDEGKVVSSGALVAQTARASEITENGTYDTTTNNSVTVNVSGGGDDPFAGLVNYLQSNSTQWIDTGYTVKDTSVFELVANVDSSNASYATPFGVRESSGSTPSQKACLIFARYSGANNLVYNWGTNDTTFVSDQIFLGQKTLFTLSKTKAGIQSQDGYCVALPITGGTATASYSVYLFSLNQGGSELGSAVRCNMKLYRFRIYEGETKVMELVPWVDGSNVACLKDTVSGNLFYNSGSGAFTYGTDT